MTDTSAVEWHWDPPLDPRDVLVIKSIERGAECCLCGDLGGLSGWCLGCGRDRPKMEAA